MRRWAFILILVVAGCARESGPVEIPSEDLPFSVERTKERTPAPDPGDRYAVYLVRDDRLIPATRRPEGIPLRSAALLRSLLEGPTSDERSQGIRTLIPADVRVFDVTVTNGDAVVDLSGEFQQPAPPEQIAIRVAQVVWTLTTLDEVRTVSFAIDGEPISVTTDSGDHVERRLTRQDYRQFAPPT